jgi:hypothetical protein
MLLSSGQLRNLWALIYTLAFLVIFQRTIAFMYYSSIKARS